ncbi:alpha/beta fold hydrolase [Paenactinomyces guangxiensis]|uniref:Alpha/beta hydrolase n=1 Tax=Paenactinomyces guangxiensis TaxID=1490290 RepID=A0A7W1WSH8_9BACL|nr:alpha/beta hydrolase [Paenactinomyces guangxiensis]MBA4495225.1 alpha/beta hydrolase [Paenactinomyces guangxiensis]MBH8592309.1 alpha/beta hydrolase [Paenactinomyces guangxiensis]
MEHRIHLKTVGLGNGETLGYREREGGNETLLLIHGNMTSSRHWDVLLEQMDEKYHIIAVDLRGFGLSTYHRPIDSMKDFADDLKLVVNALDLPSFYLMGWSMGGAVAMQFAADHPGSVRKLILLAPASTRGYPFYRLDAQGKPVDRLKTKAEIVNDPGKTIPVLQAYAEKNKDFLRMMWNSLIYTRRQPSDERYEAYLEDMCTQRNLADVYHALNTFNISSENNGLEPGSGAARRIQVPTLVLWGENDRIVTEQMVQEIIQDIGTHAQLVYLKNCGHSPLIDDCSQLIQQVTRFLNTESGGNSNDEIR